MLWMEAEIVRDRMNGLAATEALLTRAAILAALGKKGEEYFNGLIKELQDE